MTEQNWFWNLQIFRAKDTAYFLSARGKLESVKVPSLRIQAVMWWHFSYAQFWSAAFLLCMVEQTHLHQWFVKSFHHLACFFDSTLVGLPRVLDPESIASLITDPIFHTIWLKVQLDVFPTFTWRPQEISSIFRRERCFPSKAFLNFHRFQVLELMSSMNGSGPVPGYFKSCQLWWPKIGCVYFRGFSFLFMKWVVV